MSEMNRTVQSIKNARVSLFFSVLVLVLGFFMGHRTKRFFQWSGKMGERL